MTKPACLIVIPARYDSERLPGKPLADINGQSLIQRVYERAAACEEASKIIVATDDARILDHCQMLNIPCELTDASHRSGSDRVAEVLEREAAAGRQYAFVANVQGDMPFLNPTLLGHLFQAMQRAPYAPAIGTIAVPITEHEEFFSISDVKVVFSQSGRALYFSRSPIPSQERNQSTKILGYKHIGLYVYTPESLRLFSSLKPTPLETCEKLEQLRAMENDMSVHVVAIDRRLMEPAIEVDTPSDLECARIAAQKMP